MKSIGYTVKQVLSQEAKNMLEKLDNEEKLINYRKFNFKGGNNVDYDFSNFSSLKELFRVIYFGEILQFQLLKENKMNLIVCLKYLECIDKTEFN